MVAVVILAALFIYLKPAKESPKTVDAGLDDSNLETQEKVFEIVVKDKKVISGGGAMEVTEGDKVKIKVAVDAAGEVHLHGYDQEIELADNSIGEINFTADLTGRFELELHESGTALGALEVSPK